MGPAAFKVDFAWPSMSLVGPSLCHRARSVRFPDSRGHSPRGSPLAQLRVNRLSGRRDGSPACSGMRRLWKEEMEESGGALSQEIDS